MQSAAPKLTGRTVSGYAAKFDSRSENLGTVAAPWYEVIAPGAFDLRLADDVTALFNHDSNMILARSRGGRGTLKLKLDSIGLHYSFDAPNTTAGNDLLESIKRGDIDGSSFSFAIAPGGEKWTDSRNQAANNNKNRQAVRRLPSYYASLQFHLCIC